MKPYVRTVFLLVCFLFGMLTSCGTSKPIEDKVPKEITTSSNRFVDTGEVYYIDGDSSSSLKVIKDTRTGVLYLLDNRYHQGGITPLLDEKGIPSIVR